MLKASGARIELGANWIEGINPSNPERHPLWYLVQQCGGLDGIFMDTLLYDRSLRVYDHNGVNITEDANVQTRLKEFRNINEQLNKYAEYRTRKHLPDITIRKALRDKGWIPKTPIDAAIEWTAIDWTFTAPAQNLSFLFIYPSNDKIDYFVTDQKTGYVKIVDCLAKSFLGTKDTRLHLNTFVKEIDWSADCVCV